MPPLSALPLPTGLAAALFRPSHRRVLTIPAELHLRAMRDENVGPQEFIDYFRAHPGAEGAAIWQQLGIDGR